MSVVDFHSDKVPYNLNSPIDFVLIGKSWELGEHAAFLLMSEIPS